MAYHYEGIAQTQTGKIIYPRKKHLMNSKDLGRIAKSIGFPSDPLESFNWYVAILPIIEDIRKTDNGAVRESAAALATTFRTFVESNPDFEGFGGGEFGGAGSTGTWWKPLQ